MKRNDITVFTGDLIDSSRLETQDLDRAINALEAASAEIGRWVSSATMFTRSRGDSWQMILGEPRFSLRAALYLRAALKAEWYVPASQRPEGEEATSPPAPGTRISLATGTGELAQANDLNAAGGPVFIDSGQRLDKLKAPAQISTDQTGAAAAVFTLADVISRDWTEAQAAVLTEALVPDAPSQRRIGEKLEISRQFVGQVLAAVDGWALISACKAMEKGK